MLDYHNKILTQRKLSTCMMLNRVVKITSIQIEDWHSMYKKVHLFSQELVLLQWKFGYLELFTCTSVKFPVNKNYILFLYCILLLQNSDNILS